MNFAGMMICEFTLESEVFSHGPARREAVPVFVSAESEFTPVLRGGGGGVTATGPLVVAEAVTSRVSALPTVGSDIQTGLSAAVGGENRCSLSSGDDLDKVGHGTGRSEARMAPVEHLFFFSTVHNVMLSWMRPMAALTSKFFLSDEREEVVLPPYVDANQPVCDRKLYFRDVDTSTQMTKGTHRVGPIGDRWDGQRILDTWYMWCLWMKTLLWDPKLLLEGSPCLSRLGDETGSVNRNGQLEFDVDWLDEHPNRRGAILWIYKGTTNQGLGTQ